MCVSRLENIVGFLIYFASSFIKFSELPLLVSPGVHAAVLVAGIVVIAVFASTTKLHGLIRFCYHEHSTHLVYISGLLLDWWLYAGLLLLSPSLVTPAALIGVWAAATAVVYVCCAYSAQRRAVADEVAGYVSTANLAVATAREHAAAARGYEERLLGTVLPGGLDGAWEKASARGTRSRGQAAAVAGALGGETREAAGYSYSVFATAKGVDEVARLAAQARAAADRGESKKARELVAAAKEKADGVVECMEAVRQALERTRKTMLAWLERQDQSA